MVRPVLVDVEALDRMGCVKIALTQGKVAVIDADDWLTVRGHKWCVSNDRGRNWYAVTGILRGGKRTTTTMHRLIMRAAPGQMLDHINRNGLDNRKSNLRFCTQSENLANCRPHEKRAAKHSTFKGVSWHKPAKKWRATICCRGRTRHLGYFDDEAEAAMAYDEAARDLFSLACLNFG